MVGRLLLITPQFYGIEKKIKSVLEESGYEVTWIENKSFLFDYHGSNAKFKFWRKIYFFIAKPFTRYLRRELARVENHKFDILLSINAHCISRFLLKKLEKHNPELFSVLYLWDSFSMFDWKNEIKLFRKVVTFDHNDSKLYHLGYKPNFWIRSNASEISENEYDLFFTAKFSPARMAFIEKFLNQPDALQIRSFLRLWPAYKNSFHNSFLFRFFKILNFRNSWMDNFTINYEAFEGMLNKDYIIRESLDYEYVQELLSCSNVILDIPYHLQTGYSHRVIEALAWGKKVLTTNSDIKKESFYNPDQIHVIDSTNTVVDYNWIKLKSEFSVEKYIADLELSLWLKSLISERNF
jgi:hypothetical protein